MKDTFLYIRIFLMSLSLTMALVMLNTPYILIAITTLFLFSPILFNSMLYASLVYIIYDIARPTLYIWALVVTIQGKQDFIAIAFYILAALQVINILKRFIDTVCGLLDAWIETKN